MSAPVRAGGPSPRGWGEQATGYASARWRRTIPTRVGRTTRREGRRVWITDHPHAGGENSLPNPHPPLGGGPSPRGWGERCALPKEGVGSRTIPTRVGRTCVGVGHARSQADHPHAGGENEPTRKKFSHSPGPSPRGWGEHPKPFRCDAPHRTIPTRVGRTIESGVFMAGGADHPHAGGENGQQRGAAGPVCGPSPRGWGERPRPRHQQWRWRTIPTRVGRTVFPAFRCLGIPDHPHAGGENRVGSDQMERNGGPSPRGWGEPRRIPQCGCVVRTIPTRVGRTAGRSHTHARPADHPHAGGENIGHPSPPPPPRGPSPRGWGEPLGGKDRLQLPRTIPTRVGRTSRQR